MKIINNFQQLDIFVKCPILDIWPDTEYLNFALRLNLGVNELIPDIYEHETVFYEKWYS